MSKQTAVEQALFYGRRHRAAQALYPELVKGARGRGRPKLSHERVAFTIEQARTTGVAKRTIERYLAIYNALGESILMRVINTNLDNAVTLDLLKKLHPSERMPWIELHMRGRATPRRKVELKHV